MSIADQSEALSIPQTNDNNSSGGMMGEAVTSEWTPVSVSFPQARVKKVMKVDKAVGSIQHDALLRMTCAAVFHDIYPMVAGNNPYCCYLGSVSGTLDPRSFENQ